MDGVHSGPEMDPKDLNKYLYNLGSRKACPKVTSLWHHRKHR